MVLVRESRSHVFAHLGPPVLRCRPARGDGVPVGPPGGIVRERLALALGTLLAELAHGGDTTVVCATHDPLLIEQADEELSLGSG